MATVVRRFISRTLYNNNNEYICNDALFYIKQENLWNKNFRNSEVIEKILEPLKDFNLSCKQSLHFYQLIKKEDEKEIIFDSLFSKNYESINFYLRKSVCEINFKKRKKAIGFFCKISFENNSIPVLVLNKNLLDEETMKKEKIIIKIKDENKEIIINLKNKILYKDNKYDIAFIEIIEENIKNDKYFELDNILKERENKYHLQNKLSLYTIKYIKEKLFISFGELEEIFKENKNIYSFSKIKTESNIFPIINEKSNKLLGFHVNNDIIYMKDLLDLLNDFYNFIELNYYIINAINEITDKKEFIGNGSFGRVYKIKYKERIYALKEISLEYLNEKGLNNYENEANILSKLNSEYIVKYYNSYKKDNKFNIIMEYAENTNLKNYIDEYRGKHQLIEEKIINNIVKQICLGLKEIHKLNIIHRDLKPENIFINKNNLRIKIGDFGISINSIYAYSYKGTFKYMSPEMRKGSKYSNKADIYALGCILYELFTLRNYSDDNDFREIKTIDFTFYNKKWQELIDKLLEIDYHKRLNIEEILIYFD